MHLYATRYPSYDHLDYDLAIRVFPLLFGPVSQGTQIQIEQNSRKGEAFLLPRLSRKFTTCTRWALNSFYTLCPYKHYEPASTYRGTVSNIHNYSVSYIFLRVAWGMKWSRPRLQYRYSNGVKKEGKAGGGTALDMLGPIWTTWLNHVIWGGWQFDHFLKMG